MLDWGVARVVGDAAEDRRRPRDIDTSTAPRPRQVLGHARLHGARAAREPARSIAAADVYALGAILFEILARRVAAPARASRVAIASTPRRGHRDVGGAAAARTVAIPPELDALCPGAGGARSRASRPTARRSPIGSRATSTAIATSRGARASRTIELAERARRARARPRAATRCAPPGRALALDPECHRRRRARHEADARAARGATRRSSAGAARGRRRRSCAGARGPRSSRT